MISTICYALVYLLTMVIAFYYYNSKFSLKTQKKLVPLWIFGLTAVLLCINFLSNPIINSVSFLGSMFFISSFCYNAKLKSAIFNNLLLLFLMIVTELVVMFFSSMLFKIPIDASYDNQFVLILQAIVCKSLFFFSVVIMLKFSTEEKTDRSGAEGKHTVYLCVLPIASLAIMFGAYFIFAHYTIKGTYMLIMIAGCFLLLLSNIVVFYVNEQTIRTNQKYTELVLEQQKQTNAKEYYKLLKEQNDNSRILIHDIRRHLNSIKELSETGNKDIDSYINSIMGDYSNPVNYCSSSLLNLITHRYAETCQNKGIELSVNIREANINFMTEPDITSLFDNLFDNAIEAAEGCENKFIDFSINMRNKNFLVVNFANSCNTAPKKQNGVIVTTKSTGGLHGIGIKSIERVVHKYDGDINMTFDSKSNLFKTVIVLKNKQEQYSE